MTLIDRALMLCSEDDPLAEPLHAERDRLTPVSLRDLPFWMFLKTDHPLFAWYDAQFADTMGNSNLFGMFLSSVRNFGEEINRAEKVLRRIVWDDGQTYVLHHDPDKPFFMISIAFHRRQERAAPRWMPAIYRQFWRKFRPQLEGVFKGDVTPFQYFSPREIPE